MASCTYDYGDIKDTYKQARKTANKLEDYADKIENKIMKPLSSLTYGSSTNTSNAYSYMEAKVKALNEKSKAYDKYADDLDNFLNDDSGVKATDKNVATKIKDMGSIFCKANGFTNNAVYDFFVSTIVTNWNKTALGRWSKKVITNLWDGIDSACDAIKYWYKCDGGKYVVKIVVAVVVVVVAVVACIVAWPAAAAALAGTLSFAAVAAVATFVGAVIAAANAVTDLVFNCVALAHNNSDPAWAKRYDSYDGMASALRKNRFKTSIGNKLSVIGASSIEVVTFICDVIAVAQIAKNGVSMLKNWKTVRTQLKTCSIKNMFSREMEGLYPGCRRDARNTFKEVVKFDYKFITDYLTQNPFKDAGKGKRYYDIAKRIKDAKWVKQANNAAKFINSNVDGSGTTFRKGGNTWLLSNSKILKPIHTAGKSGSKVIKGFKSNSELWNLSY